MRFVTVLVAAVAAVLCLVNPAFAIETADAAGATSDFGLLAAGFGIAIAVLGGALGQGKATAAAVEGIGRNPGASGNMFLPFLLGLVLIESLVIYALVISAKLVGLF